MPSIAGRCPTSRRQHDARRRADKVAKLQALITARNAFGETAKRAQPARGLRTLQAWVKRHKLETFVHVSLHEGRLRATLDPAAQAETALLDGCYVLETEGQVRSRRCAWRKERPMPSTGTGQCITVYFGEADHWQHQPLSMALLEMLRREGCSGATVTRGVASFGAGSRIKTATLRGRG
jgi:hypothetical protein